MRLTRRGFAAGIATGFVSPSVISGARAQGSSPKMGPPIKIGMCAPISGRAPESGAHAINGARLAVDIVNKAGGVLGKPIELIVEDDQTTNPGVALGSSKLPTQTDIVVFVGTIRSSQARAMAPDVINRGKPVMMG